MAVMTESAQKVTADKPTAVMTRSAQRVTAQDAAALVRSGDWLDYGAVLAQPDAFDKALAVDHDQSAFCQVRPVLADVSMKSPPRPQSPATRPASSGQEADPQLMSAERPDLRALLLDLLRASPSRSADPARLG